MDFYYGMGTFIGVFIAVVLVVYFIILPIAVIVNLLSIPAPKIDDTEWQDALAIDKQPELCRPQNPILSSFTGVILNTREILG